MDLERFFDSMEWQLVSTLSTADREEKFFGISDLPLSTVSKNYLEAMFPSGLYLHQKDAISRALDNENVCMATSTASGKSLAFFVAAIEQITNDPASRILAIYPMRALGREQEGRWERLFKNAGMTASVGRIDGSVKPISKRPKILQESNVVVCTPDVLHAWFLSNLNNKDVQDFFKNLSLVIVDEVHTYKGVFGSNAAFLFRRLQHLCRMLGSSPQFICASATISKPSEHLNNLFGVDFALVGQDKDTSPSYGYNIYLVNTPDQSDFLTEIVQILKYLATETSSRFITFVDSRKQVELITSILARGEGKVESRTADKEDGDDFSESGAFNANLLEQLDVLPYRAGYESADRQKIQQRLTAGSLHGVVSTSALELGIDIPHLETCVLIGVPHSQTSLHQRIGRVGRIAKGHVIVIGTGSVHDEAVFRNPETFLDRPLAEGALYLENEYIQYIHALCLARVDGEHDEIANVMNLDVKSGFNSDVSWPPGFIDVCIKERTGQIQKAFQMMKVEAGESPNYTYPLRDVGSQFKVEHKRRRTVSGLGSLSFSQLMREAYPGAVYYYAAEPYRVYRVQVRSRQVDVRKEKYYITKPQSLPALVFPNLTAESIHHAYLHGELVLIECDLQIRESIGGFRERRGPNEFTQNYPVPVDLNIFFDQRYFTRTYFSTGVLLTHKSLNREGVNTRLLAQLIYEAFLSIIPFERQDINFSSDKHRARYEPLIEAEDRFITIFDETYGSLRLTGRLMREGILEEVLTVAMDFANSDEVGEVTSETLTALDDLIEAAQHGKSTLAFDVDQTKLAFQEQTQYERVILPGSKGLNLNRDNEEFFVDRVFLGRDGLRYEGITETHIGHLEKTVCMPFVSDIVEIPGVSEVGFYNYDTGQVEEIPITVEIKTAAPSKPMRVRREIDKKKLHFVLSKHFREEDIRYLCTGLNVEYESFEGESTQDRVAEIVEYCDQENLIEELLMSAFQLHKQLEGGNE